VINVFLPLLGATKGFKGQPGKIINNSSLAGVFNTPFNGAYCVSKHAVESLGEIYRRELMLYGIDVVSIQSGPIESQIWTKNIGIFDEFDNSDYAKMLKKAEAIMANAEKDALPAVVISKLIYKILNSRNPKTSYIVNKNKFLTKVLVKYLPSRWVDRLLWKKLS
jgi:short-subunit dehydrogenase